MTEYSNRIGEILTPRVTEEALVLDLFAGCGGLSLGFEAAGFHTIGYEMMPEAVKTYNRNLTGVCHNELLTTDFEYPDADKIDIVIGGPPCQPFSRFGNQQGIKDARDGFPIFIEAVRKIRPKVFMFENVANITGRHRWYLDLIVSELGALGYFIEYQVLNAKDYEVPQNRERLICVGHRSSFSFPVQCRKQTSVREAISDSMNDANPEDKILTPNMDRYIAEYEKKSHCVNPRDLNPEKPARTITCRNLAGATSDMQRVRLPDGRRRRLTDREAARLQSFPDWFSFSGNETQRFNQIGNAVPPLMAYRIAMEIKNTYHREALEPAKVLDVRIPDSLFEEVAL